jgi:hypothetical protein
MGKYISPREIWDFHDRKDDDDVDVATILNFYAA